LALVIITRRAVLCAHGAVLLLMPLPRFFRVWNMMDPSRIYGVWVLCSMRLSVALYPSMARPYWSWKVALCWVNFEYPFSCPKVSLRRH